jgi:hypothetical protein
VRESPAPRERNTNTAHDCPHISQNRRAKSQTAPNIGAAKDEMEKELLDSRIGRIGVERLHVIRHGEIELDLARGNRFFEPLRVDRLDRPGLEQISDDTVDDLLERCVALCHHAAVRFTRLRRADDDEFLAALGLGAFAVENGVVHHETRPHGRFPPRETIACFPWRQ